MVCVFRGYPLKTKEFHHRNPFSKNLKKKEKLLPLRLSLSAWTYVSKSGKKEGGLRQFQPSACFVSDGNQRPVDAVTPHGDPDGFFGAAESSCDCGNFERCPQERDELCRVAEFGVVSPDHGIPPGERRQAVRAGWLW